MGFFTKTAEEVYANSIKELQKLTKDIRAHQVRANALIGKGNLLVAGQETKRAFELIGEARYFAKELEKACGKLGRKVPDIVKVLLYEGASEEAIKKKLRQDGVKA